MEGKMVGVVFVVLVVCDAVQGIWPPPRHHDATGSHVHLCPAFKISTTHSSDKLEAAIHRTHSDLNALRVMNKATTTALDCIPTLKVMVRTNDETLSLTTRYDYTITIANNHAVVVSTTVYGAMYAMESFLQLTANDALRSTLFIDDAPQHAWRGLMIDSGRRFFPVPLVKNLLDTMAAVKLNVLHLHASDMCRYGVQSQTYPNLTDSLTGVLGGYYTQQDIKDMVQYAGMRGIRVMPEFDVPGHSHGFIPVESQGAVFCNNAPQRSQLYGDPANKTFNLLKNLFKEMVTLFPDDVFHIGCDETNVQGPCTLDSTFALERSVLNTIQQVFNKTPAGWEEIYFDAGAATSSTIVFTWSRHEPKEVTATGRRVVENSGAHFYFTDPGPAGPAGWDRCWYDITTGVPTEQLPLVLGGEMSMWTDTYCYIQQCLPGNNPAVGAKLFPPEQDAAFSRSVGGMIWPRGFVGAAAFWQYNTTTDPGSPAFIAAINNLTNTLIQRGAYACPSNCNCDQLSACGVPYIQPPTPVVNTPLNLQACNGVANISSQRWLLEGGQLKLQYNQSLCLTLPSHADAYPAVLGLCTSATTFTHTVAAQLVASSGGQCLDAREGDGAVGSWDCGAGQPNQMWSFDADTGLLASLGVYSGQSSFGGMCVTAGSATLLHQKITPSDL